MIGHAPMRTVLKLSKAAAFRAVRSRKQFAWLEDVAQEVATTVWLAQQRGHGTGPLQYRRYAFNALNAIVGDARWAGKALRHVALDVAPELFEAPAELGALAVWRLQRMWPELSAGERAGAFSLIAGDGYGAIQDGASAVGVDKSAARRGQLSVLKRLGEASQ